MAITALGAGGYFIFLSPYFKIAKVHIQYEEFQDENEELLTNFNDFKGKNILFADPEKRVQELKNRNPEFDKLMVQKIIPNTLKISFSEYPIVANIEKIINGKLTGRLLINAKGMVIYRDTENPNLPYIKVFIKEKREAEAPPQETTQPLAPKNEIAIPTDYLTYILDAQQNFTERFCMKVFEMRFYPQSRELHLKTEKGFLIWLDMQIPFERQFLKLKKSMSLLNMQGSPLEYIDLRISGTNGEKVIFKRKK